MRKADKEQVVHPTHYNRHPSGIECWDINQYMSANIGAAFKYVYRRGEKGDPIVDLQKALQYIDKEIEMFKEMIAKKFISEGHPVNQMLVVASNRSDLIRIVAFEQNPHAARFYSQVARPCPRVDIYLAEHLMSARDAVEKLIEECKIGEPGGEYPLLPWGLLAKCIPLDSLMVRMNVEPFVRGSITLELAKKYAGQVFEYEDVLYKVEESGVTVWDPMPEANEDEPEEDGCMEGGDCEEKARSFDEELIAASKKYAHDLSQGDYANVQPDESFLAGARHCRYWMRENLLNAIEGRSHWTDALKSEPAAIPLNVLAKAAGVDLVKLTQDIEADPLCKSAMADAYGLLSIGDGTAEGATIALNNAHFLDLMQTVPYTASFKRMCAAKGIRVEVNIYTTQGVAAADSADPEKASI
ncbi:hypothetical protein [Burkholderia phage BCSR5]|nr:hypothetical protein [Burkholderia phage BCSR5]